MTRTKLSASAALLFAVLLCGGCKGRTMENMEPTGDTVTVSLQRIDREAAADSISTLPDSTLNP